MKACLVYVGVATLLLVLLNAPASATDSNLNCTNGSCDEDEAPCPPDSAPEMGPDGGPCVCMQKHCVQPVCRYGSQRVLQKHGTSTPGDCCDIYECMQPKEKNCSEIVCPKDVECPTDSYRLPSHKAPSDCCSVAQGCQCLPGSCPTATCPEGEHASVVRPGSGKPGACCPLSECLNHDLNDTCVRDGKVTKNGTEWWTDDECTLCRCNYGIIFCAISPECPDLTDVCTTTRIPIGECCPICVDDYPNKGILLGCNSANGKIRQNGESWQEDPCTTCECLGGLKKCQAYMCEVTCVNPKYVDGECCPLCDGTSLVTLPPHCPVVNNCSLRCMHGFKRDDAGCYVFPCQCEAEQCLLECPRGYLQDPHGNKLCKCAVDVLSPAAPKCPALTNCRKNCSHGFRLNKAGCEVCKCTQCRPLNDCNKNCPHGFRANDRGCQICKCRASSEPLLSEDSLHLTLSNEDATCISTDGGTHDVGEAWFDGCRQCYCHSGVEMCNLIACPATKCNDPIFNSSTGCCPRCPDDVSNLSVKEDHRTMLCQSVDGAYRVEGETWPLNEQTRCLCHAGRVLCEGKQCPPASCAQPIYKPGQSCPTCSKSEVAVSGVACSNDHPHGADWREDNCRSCTCDSGLVTCFNEVCPALKCDRPILAKNWCCAVCLDRATPKTCEVGNVTYNGDEKWNEDACTHCVCQEGAKFCTEKVCSVACANPIKKPGKCCPICKTEPSSSVGLFNESTYLGIITVLFCIIFFVAIFVAYQRCRRRRQMVVNTTSSHSYANYSTHTPPPQYASADRRDPYQYKYVQSFDATQIDEMLKSPSISATEKMALAPV